MPPADANRIDSVARWTRLIVGCAAVFALFQWTALELRSDFGESGIAIALLVVAATLGIERLLFGNAVAPAARFVGLGRPSARGLLAAAPISLLLLLVPTLVHLGDTPLALQPDWTWMLPGLFAQGGVAEEVLFRGYLFGHLRRGRAFWRAAALSLPPFVAVHLLMFLTMPWPIAFAATLLAVAMSLPLAYLFEIGGGTIWAPALLHFVVQGTIKVLVIPAAASSWFALAWMAAAAVLPMLVFLVPRRA